MLEKAKSYAFLLLKFRLRSEKEILRRLEGKNFAPELVRQVISFLKEKGFLDDELFAKSWIESRLKKPLGLARLRQELEIKGIDREIINRQIEQIKNNYSEEEIVAKLAKERWLKLKAVEPKKAKQRVYGYLLRRGFSPSVVIDILGQL